MTFPKQHEPMVPVISEPSPQRPKTLLQRLSSGIAHVLPSFRTSIPKNGLINRPTTAPGLTDKRARKEAIGTESEQQLFPRPEPTAISGPTPPWPYNPDSYHSFATIEKRRCSFCGMRGPKIVHNDPCHGCRTGDPGSHTSSDRKHLSTHRRHSAIDARHLAHLGNSSDSVLLGPRPVTPERAAKRVGNPPRVSKLPPGIMRLPVANQANTNQHRDPIARPPSRLDIRSPESRSHSSHPHGSHSNTTGSLIKKSTSPKLHHLHGLSNSENFPFVHRHEISKHAIALRAGSTSPLTDRSNSPKSSPNVHGPTDYSNTVYYGGRKLPLSSNRTSLQKPQITTAVVKQLHASGSAVIDLRASPLDAALAASEVYRERSPKRASARLSQAMTDVIDSSTTFGSPATDGTRVGGMRLELKGGTSIIGAPRLRGGSGRERVSTNTFSFKLKRWLLTCHGPCPNYFDDSDDDLPPPRVVTPDRVVKTRRKMNGTAPLPAHLCRGAPSVASISSAPQACLGTEGIPPATTFITTISGPPKRSSSSRLSISALFHRHSESPINQSATVTPSQTLTPPFPYLRGGADSPDKIPPTLFWLAGGTGRKPSKFSGWKQSRPKHRMSGLLGMAIFGDKYGQEYKIEARAVGDVEVECSASVKVTVGDAMSVKEVEGGVGVSSSVSSSSASSMAKPAKDSTGGAEEAVSIGNAEPVQRVLTLLQTKAVDNVPLCSSALPVEPLALPAGVATPGLPNDGSDKRGNASVRVGQKDGSTRRHGAGARRRLRSCNLLVSLREQFVNFIDPQDI